MRFYLPITLAFIIASGIWAQDVSIEVSAPGEISIGQNFRISYRVTGDVDKYVQPSFSDFTLLSGPNRSSSFSSVFSNGRMVTTRESIISYAFRAEKAGTFTINPMQVVSKGTIYKSEPVEITVHGESSQGSPTSSQSQITQQEAKPKSTEKRNLFVRIIINKKNVYKGEPLVATIKLYSRYNIREVSGIKFPSYNSFWSQEVYRPKYLETKYEVIDGKEYATAVLSKTLLIPQRSGKLQIDAYEIDCQIIKRVSFFSSQTAMETARSYPVTIYVKELPKNAPEDFTGGVGEFSLFTSIDKTEVKANDALTYKIRLTGKGNIKLTDVPKILFPPDFEVFDPKVTENIDNSVSGSSGVKTVEYLIIPRHAGNYRIPLAEFSYFDLKTKKYKTIRSKEFNITVEKGTGEDPSQVVSGFSKEAVKVLDSDILFIKTKDIKLKKINSYFFSSLYYYLIFIGLFMVFVFTLMLRRKKLKERANVELLRNKKANKMAKKRLRLAKRYLKEDNIESFYEELVKGIWGYLSDKLTIPLSDLSKDKALITLQKNNIDQDMINQLSEAIDECEYARYAPEKGTYQMQKAYDRAVVIISSLEQKLK